MNEREELIGLRRLAELEDKAAGIASPEQKGNLLTNSFESLTNAIDPRTFPSSAAKVKDAFTGESQNPENLPEIGNLMFGDKVKQALPFARGNPIAESQIFKNFHPDSEIEFDDNGRAIATLNEKKGFLNQPGMSEADMRDLALDVPMFIGAAKIGSIAAKKAGLGPIVEGLGAGSSIAAASIGTDKVSQILGSEQSVDQKRALILGGLGFVGETAVLFAEKFLGVFSRSKNLFKDDKLTEKGAKVLKDAGIDPDVATPEFIQLFKAQPNNANPEQVARVVTAQSLPKEVKLTRGQVTQSLPDQSVERRIQGGQLGTDAQQTVDQTFKQQADDLAENASLIQQEIGGGVSKVSERGQGAQIAVDAIQAEATTAKQSIKAAFEGAKKLKAQAPIEVVKEFSDTIKKDLINNSFSIEGSVGDRLNQLNKVLNMKGVKSVQVKALESWRKSVSRKLRDAKKNPERGEEAAALGRVLRNFDDSMDNALINGLVTGEEAAIKAWQQARGLRAEFGRKFESDKIVKQLIEKDITQEQGANLILGLAKLGSNRQAVQTLRAIKKIVKDGSPAFTGIKEEAFRQFLRNQPEKGWSALKYRTAVSDFFKDQPTLAKELFNESDRRLINKLKFVSDTTIPLTGSVNHSVSGDRVVQVLVDMFGPGGRRLVEFGKAATNKATFGAGQRATTQEVLRGSPTKERLFTQGTGAAATAITAEEL